MSKYKKLSHVVYKCDYHIVWVPKYRYRILKGAVKEHLEKDLRTLCEWKKAEIVEVNIQEDHVHLIISIPPKISVSEMMGIIKGKTAIKIFRSYPELKKKPYWGNHFWARGYFCATVGQMTEEMIKQYLEHHFEPNPNDEFKMEPP